VDDESHVINPENRVEMEFQTTRRVMEFRVAQGTAKDAETARRAIEESVRRIPDAALKGLQSFRLIALM
jgi:hypothetical protein